MNDSDRARIGAVSLGIGVAAAGVGAAVGIVRNRLSAARDRVDYRSLRLPGFFVAADDGTAVHVQVDEPETRPPEGTPTLVFCHGYALSSDSWYFQRSALRGRFRMVFWDQRGHGRSAMGAAGTATIDHLGADLWAVLREAVPDGPVVLVGHSMGGMTVMALADQAPDLFGSRIRGVVFVSTSAGGSGLGRVGRRVHPGNGWVNRAIPSTVRMLSRAPYLVTQGRRFGRDVEAFFIERYAYAAPVSPAVVLMTTELIAGTDLRVVSDFMPAFARHDKREALDALRDTDVVVMVGDTDLFTPARHSERIVERLPRAEHVVVHPGGHLLMMEHPDTVTEYVVEVAERVRSTGPGPAGRSRTARPRRTVTPLRRRITRR
jgi:pimeloyl-ACP methyl ester carboxylesterase